jgi:PIN domain nuclease of toxin-antitoxin system
VNLLLDTQTVLWWRDGNRRLGRRAKRAIASDATRVVVSAASIWEIAIKSSIGRLKLRDPWDVWMPEALEAHGLNTLSISVAHAVAVAALPRHHTDPFDRLLIAQAQLEQLTILTADSAFDDYDVAVLDARA